jgi:hypothetical protein
MRKLTLIIRLVLCLILVSSFCTHQLWAQTTCPTITNTRLTAVTVCSGKAVDSLQVATTALPPNTIEFVRFDAVQTNPYLSSDGTHLGEISAENGLATQRTVNFPANTAASAKTYYVYACLKPMPTDPACAPFALITITIAACDCPPQKCVPITIRRVK